MNTTMSPYIYIHTIFTNSLSGSSSSELTDKSLPLVAALPTKTRRSEAIQSRSVTAKPWWINGEPMVNQW